MTDSKKIMPKLEILEKLGRVAFGRKFENGRIIANEDGTLTMIFDYAEKLQSFLRNNMAEGTRTSSLGPVIDGVPVTGIAPDGIGRTLTFSPEDVNAEVLRDLYTARTKVGHNRRDAKHYLPPPKLDRD